MFTALQKVASYLWYGDDDDNDNDGQTNPDDSTLNEGAPAYPKWKTVTGKVSHVYSRHGLVQGEIYFNFDSVIGGARPVVGDVVNVVSKQENEGGGWKGVQVTVLGEVWDTELSPSTWNGSSVDAVATEEEVPVKKENVIGKVTSFAGGKGIINDNIMLQWNDCISGYEPYTGDWVKVEVVVSDDNSLHAVSVHPLRTLAFEGEITAIREDHGYVETKDGRSIFYPSSVIESGYFPRRRDIVKGRALESMQGQCVWRATSLSPFHSVTSEWPINVGSPSPVSKEDLQHLRKDKNGIYVSGDTNFGTVTSGEVSFREVLVRNQGTRIQILRGCHIHGQSKMFYVKGIHFIFEHAHLSASGRKRNPEVAANESAILYPAMGLYVAVVCEASYIGSEEQLLVLEFDGFCIGQQLSVNVTDPNQLYIEPVPNNGYQGNRSDTFQRARNCKNGGWVVPGERPINRFRGRFHLPQRLPQFSVPDELRDCVLDQEELTEVCPQLQQELSIDCYAGKFHSLLHLEEIQMDIDIRQFDLEQVCLRPLGEFLCLGVPDLAEGRPSLLIGDKVVLSEPGCMDGLSYEGYIHEVLSEEVLLKFHRSFHQNYQGESYDVVFTFNRSTIRRCHQAVDMALQLGEQVLFPEEVVPKLPQWIPGYREPEMMIPVKQGTASTPKVNKKSRVGPLELFNSSLNERQGEAVIRIVLGQGRPTPYILFGPPGTGKTVTVVESILQIFMKVPHSRIIACTPSNSAADLLTERLQQSEQLTTADMIRINALQRTEESIPDSIRPYCYDDTNLKKVSHYRIIMCTCASAGMLLSLGIRVGHFTHVFVDEAGQATEPECLIPISLIAQSDGQIVLAGDPHQLGPVLASKFAKSYGLELSLLERLTLRPAYQRDVTKFQQGYNPLLVTKLIDNYRSHESLLRLPSRLFYHDELCVKADPALTQSFSNWSNLPTKGCPLIFHGVRGEDMREGNSPSWFNPTETVQVVQYVQMLLHEEPHRIAPEEIGIITAYRKQVEKIRLLMDKLGIPKIKVGSVEEFQGQERKAVIISTVRSTENLLGFDVRHNLGFLSNPKRFNVSITRAQALLIVVGNPFVLAQDPYWRALIGYSIQAGAYTGCDPPDDYNNNNGN